MELRRYLQIIRRRLWLIVLAVAIAVGVLVATTEQTTTYSATSTLYVGASNFSPDEVNSNLSGDEVVGLSQLIRTFAAMIDSTPVAEDALEVSGVRLSAGAVLDRTEATPVFSTNLLEIEVTDGDPATAQALATGLAEAFVARIGELEPDQTLGEGDIPSAPAQIFERAQLPTIPSTTPLLPKLVTAALIALALSTGLILLVEYLDITVKTPEDAEARLELPVLATIPVLDLEKGRALRPPRQRHPEIGLVQDA